jgi:hypothetical protein
VRECCHPRTCSAKVHHGLLVVAASPRMRVFSLLAETGPTPKVLRTLTRIMTARESEVARMRGHGWWWGGGGARRTVHA